MERLNKNYRYQNCVVASYGWNSGSHLRLALTEKYKRSDYRLDCKMKVFLSSVTITCFVFSAVAGISTHTLMEAEVRKNIIATKLVTLSLRELSQEDI